MLQWLIITRAVMMNNNYYSIYNNNISDEIMNTENYLGFIDHLGATMCLGIGFLFGGA